MMFSVVTYILHGIVMGVFYFVLVLHLILQFVITKNLDVRFMGDL